MWGKFKHVKEDREEGFTLIELLVVIVIIGILVTIAIGAFLNQRKTANDAAVKSDMRNMINVTEPLFNEYYDPGKDDPNTFVKQIQIKGVSSPQFNDPEDSSGTGTVEIQMRDKDSKMKVMDKVSLSDGVKVYIIRHNADSINPATTNDGYAIWMYHKNGKEYTLDSPLRWTNQIEGGGQFYEL